MLCQAHPQVACVQLVGCGLLHNVCFGSDEAGVARSEAGLARSERAAEAGALEVVVAAMRAHLHVAGVQEIGCIALVELCGGPSDAARARRQRATEAGGRVVVVAAMQAGGRSKSSTRSKSSSNSKLHARRRSECSV